MVTLSVKLILQWSIYFIKKVIIALPNQLYLGPNDNAWMTTNCKTAN